MEWTKEKQRIIREDCIWELGLCGCGSTDAYDVVLALLERSEKLGASAIGDKVPSFYDSMEDEDLTASPPWVEFGAKVLDHAGLLEHGSGIGHAWMTEEGTLLLEFLREFGTEEKCDPAEEGWPDWATGELIA